MSLIGKSFKDYEIIIQTGKGGMRDVYQAKDQMLD